MSDGLGKLKTMRLSMLMGSDDIKGEEAF